jgi:6-pyruvoyltetrahydropterin/6-carboxytetrahydropterin synthase
VFRVTRRYQFAASHRLYTPLVSEEANRRLYGKCAQPYGHGHNYVIEVSARGPLEAHSGRAVDLAILDELVRRQVLEPMDHRNLNLEVEVFRRTVPTSENLGVEICRRLKRNWSTVFAGDWPKLETIRIQETSRNAFEIRADEVE